MDLTDPMVREMADRNHVPDEITRRTASGGVAYTEVVCEQCGATWPCETRRKLRQLDTVTCSICHQDLQPREEAE